jgi:hypothetical protein
MILSTFENHFKFGRASDDESIFVVECGPRARDVMTPKLEAINAAKLIADSAGNEKIKLCLSGGIDSECMLESFIEAKIPFDAVFLKFEDDFNNFDIKTNVEICQSKNIKINFIDLNVIDFLESGKCFEVAKKYECQSPQLATHLWLIEQLDGIPVLGGNPFVPTWNNDHLFYLGLPGELHCTYFKFFEINDRLGIPWFFLYTPELASSFFQLECVKPFVHSKLSSDTYTYLKKCQSYEEGGFLAKPRHDKFTGFERVRAYYDEKYNTKNGITFNTLYRKPLEELFPFPESYVQLVPKNYFEL